MRLPVVLCVEEPVPRPVVSLQGADVDPRTMAEANALWGVLVSYDESWTHLSLDKDTPTIARRATCSRSSCRHSAGRRSPPSIRAPSPHSEALVEPSARQYIGSSALMTKPRSCATGRSPTPTAIGIGVQSPSSLALSITFKQTLRARRDFSVGTANPV
jgi:hypothetical protein